MVPSKVCRPPPVSPEDFESIRPSVRAFGLRSCLLAMANGCRDEAEKRIGHHLPKATLPVVSAATVIAWIWTRTVTCSQPGSGINMLLFVRGGSARRRPEGVCRDSVRCRWPGEVRRSATISKRRLPPVGRHHQRTGANCVGSGPRLNSITSGSKAELADGVSNSWPSWPRQPHVSAPNHEHEASCRHRPRPMFLMESSGRKPS